MNRAARRVVRNFQGPEDNAVTETGQYPQLLNARRDLLLAKAILDALLKARIDTLVVVPITLRYVNEADKSEIPVSTIGTVPFPALPIDGGKTLVDFMSVVVVPGFYVFQKDPQTFRRNLSPAIIVGDPTVPTNAAYFFAPAERSVALGVRQLADALAWNPS